MKGEMEIMEDSFKSFHPVVNFTYFAAVIAFSMFFMHPVFLAISIMAAFTYSVMLNGRKAVKSNLLYMLPFFIFMAILNPAFNHEGTTILFYLSSGNPITLESVIYGIAAACMFVAVILWFSCYNAVMTSDKFIYIFGKIIPSLSLIISMVLRFVPKYKAQIKVITNAQKCVGRDILRGNILERAKNGIKILSIMTTWALENAIITSDSMKSRGYGLEGRTSFSNFKFDNRDKTIFALIISLAFIILMGGTLGQNAIRFFPSIKIARVTAFSFINYISYFVLCFIPIIISIAEEVQWKRIKSKI